MKALIVVAALIALSGCDFKATVAEKDKDKIVQCKDTRDGETFKFNTSTVTNARVGADAGFDVIDTNGKPHSLRQSMEAFLKCEQVRS